MTDRRRILQIALGGGALAALGLPERWVRPIVKSVIVPAHAQASPGPTTTAAPTTTTAAPTATPSDIRLKRDITLVGRLDDGLGLYRYRYLWSDTVYVGVMAQEVALIHPEAIVRDALDDYLRVDYGRLGLHLMTLPEWDARSKGERL